MFTTIEKIRAEQIKGLRLGALDYGGKRIGFAVCDELHIVISTRGIFHNSPRVFDEITTALKKENIGFLVIGFPLFIADEKKGIHKKIREFAKKLYETSGMKIVFFDESNTTKQAFGTMNEVSMKRKDREKSGKRDEIAAAIILQEFLESVL